MFKLKTYRRSFNSGFNLGLPFGHDYFSSGSLGGSIGGPLGGAITHEFFKKHPFLAFKRAQRGGQVGGHASVASGHPKKANSGKVTGRRNASIPGYMEKIRRIGYEKHTVEERSKASRAGGFSMHIIKDHKGRSIHACKMGFISGLKRAIISGIEKELAQWQQ